MSENHAVTSAAPTTARKGLTGGLILIGIGGGLLLAQLTNTAMYVPLLAGAIFLAAGILTRKAGLLVPGGIISGVGLGALSTQMAWFYPTNSVESGGIFLLFFSLGFLSITLLSRVFTSEPNNWALIPGLALAAIGGLVLMGEQGVRILEIAGRFWPVILVVIGVGMLFGWWNERKN